MGSVLSVLQLSGTSVEPFFSPTSLPKSDLGIFSPFIQTRRASETRQCMCDFSTDFISSPVGFSVQPTTRHIVIPSDMRSLLTAHYHSGLATVTVCSSGTFLLVVVACIPSLKAAWTCLRRPLQDEETKRGVPRNNGS
jgi:hypothetical protein